VLETTVAVQTTVYVRCRKGANTDKLGSV